MDMPTSKGENKGKVDQILWFTRHSDSGKPCVVCTIHNNNEMNASEREELCLALVFETSSLQSQRIDDIRINDPITKMVQHRDKWNVDFILLTDSSLLNNSSLLTDSPNLNDESDPSQSDALSQETEVQKMKIMQIERIEKIKRIQEHLSHYVKDTARPLLSQRVFSSASINSHKVNSHTGRKVPRDVPEFDQAGKRV